MKISKILLETVLPITIGTLLLIGYFFVTNELFSEPGLESCEGYQIYPTVYLTYMLVIVIISSLYQITLGKWILKRNENSFALRMVNSLTFAIFFTGILVIINLFQKQRKIEWDFFFIIFLITFLLGLLFSTLIKLFQKIFRRKYVN